MSRLECIAVEADGGGEGQEVEVVLMEPRPFRPFKSSEEYLVAMKEDLAEWLHRLYYPQLNIDFDNFMDVLEDGVALCKVNHFIPPCICRPSSISSKARKVKLMDRYPAFRECVTLGVYTPPSPTLRVSKLFHENAGNARRYYVY